MSPYATGGGGVTFERKVAVQYLAHLLVADGATELGDGRRVASVAFQQVRAHPADDLVISAAYPDQSQSSLVLDIAVRRAPSLVLSDKSTRKLFGGLVQILLNLPTSGPEHRLALLVAGPQPHAEQLATLADLAAAQMDAPGFFELIRSPSAFDAAIRGRLDQIEKLVERSLTDLSADVNTALVQRRVWQLLSRLVVRMPRLESPDETDWSTVANTLIPVARGSDLTGALQLRDRLVALASEYSPRSARVDLTVLRRDVHPLIDATKRHNEHGWRILDHLHKAALASVRSHITSRDGARQVRLDRSEAAARLVKATTDAAGVVVSGESGVGKSALALLSLSVARAADPDSLQTLCINLRQIPKLPVDFEATLGSSLPSLLGELSAPRRLLIVDGADAAHEGMKYALRHLVHAAKNADVQIVAVTSVDSEQIVRDILTERYGEGVAEYAVAPLSDTEITEVIETFTELEQLNANPRSRVLLRRLVVIDLLVRGRIAAVPLTDADAMSEVWSGLIRRQTTPDRGSPDARELALLILADLELVGGQRLHALNGIDPAALKGLRRDGLLRTSVDNPFMIGPEFAHDEVRRYAVARLFLAERDPAAKIKAAGAPRWSLAAARLASQALLAEPDRPTAALRGRFAALQGSFDELVEAGHGARWGDVPSEALITLANPSAVLKDAWPGLLADKGTGMRRVARLFDQRLRDDSGFVDIIAVEPIITLLLEDSAPWRLGKHAEGLLRSWLRAHVVANTPAGNPLRVQLRGHLVQACAAADRRLVKEQEAAAAAHAARTPAEIERERRFEGKHAWAFSEIGYGGRPGRRRPEVPREITDEIVLELLALLGPDLGPEGEAILRRVAQDAPPWLFPAVDDVFTGRALAAFRRGLLAHLTEAYYVDAEADGSDHYRYGVRRHRKRSFGDPLAAWHLGPFMSLFQTDFRNGVVFLNHLLNHAALIRARVLTRARQSGQPPEDGRARRYQTGLEVSGERKLYVGDEHVWLWYRGTGVGPYPCFSALQALERVCDQLIDSGAPPRSLVEVLLEGCENIAMVSFVVGLLVRHLEQADQLLDPYLAEPLIWHHEFNRVASESYGFAADSEGLASPERRKWSLREAGMFMVVRAHDERASALRVIGETLVRNARRLVQERHDAERTKLDSEIKEETEKELMPVRAWASVLDRNAYEARELDDGLYVRVTVPEDVGQALQESNEDLHRTQEATRLVVRYHARHREELEEAIGPKELAADLAMARLLLENPPALTIHDPWDTATLVAAAALEAHLLHGRHLQDDALTFAANTVLRIGEGEVWPRPAETEETCFEQAADRSAARVLPLLLLPSAARLRAAADQRGQQAAMERVAVAGVNLARAVANEVRLHLARGLDRVWETPCVQDGRCHHEVGLLLASETMRDCVLGHWAPDSGGRSVVVLEEPYTESLAHAAGDSVLPFRLDGAIRALAPAAMADICVSTRARALVSVLLSAQRKSLRRREPYDADPRGSQTLVSARALLTLAQNGDDARILESMDAYSGHSALLDNFLRALSATAEETPERAAIARRIWPSVVRHVLELNDSGHAPVQGGDYADMALAALIPNSAPDWHYLYREVQSNPIEWWSPLALRPEVEAWLVFAAGIPMCVDRLIVFLGVLRPKEQIRIGLPWVKALVLSDPARVAAGSVMISTWLIEKRAAAVDTGFVPSWQEIVDALVVAGVTRLAIYSD